MFQFLTLEWSRIRDYRALTVNTECAGGVNEAVNKRK